MEVPYVITTILPLIIILISVISNPLSRSKYTKDKFATVIVYKYKILVGVILSVIYIIWGVIKYNYTSNNLEVYTIIGAVIIFFIVTVLTPNPLLSCRELKQLKKEKSN